MKLQPKKFWLISAIASSVAVLILAVILALVMMKNKSSDIEIWPRDEEAQLRDANLSAINQAGVTPLNVIREIDQADHLIGKPDAKVKLVVYLDFDCPYCATFNKTLNELERIYGDRIVIALRHFPLDSHANAPALANAFECAVEQDKMLEAKDYLYSITRDRSDSDFQVMAESLKLSKEKFQDCLKANKFSERINSDKAEAKSAGVIGTPTSFLNGMILPGAYKLEDFKTPDGSDNQGLKSLIDAELAK